MVKCSVPSTTTARGIRRPTASRKTKFANGEDCSLLRSEVQFYRVCLQGNSKGDIEEFVL